MHLITICKACNTDLVNDTMCFSARKVAANPEKKSSNFNNDTIHLEATGKSKARETGNCTTEAYAHAYRRAA